MQQYRFKNQIKQKFIHQFQIRPLDPAIINPSNGNFMKNNRFNNLSSIFILLIITTLLLSLQCLKIHPQQNNIHHNSNNPNHEQNNENIYDQQKYLVDLAQKQNQFKQKIIQIQNNFAGINMMLNDTNLSQNEKKIKLTEAIADQRDALISAQSILNVPYQLKSCQCLNLTDQKKQTIKSQLQKVKLKIQQLDKASQQTNNHCQPHKCPLMKQVNSQIQMMKNYQNVMEMTISSKCCKVVKYQYRDNLDTNNWHFGNTTQSLYQAQIFQRQQTKDIKLQPCPYQAPFVKIQQNSCFNCPPDRPLFNLGKRVCEKDCSESSANDAFVLNLTTHICGYNTNCPQGQYFDEAYKKCAPTPTYYNESSCPPTKPFWDPLSYSCQSCPPQTPFFDAVLKKCRTCNQNEKWNENTRLCEGAQNCGQGFYFDSATKKCVANNKDTHSLCPPGKPYWNQATYSCDQCPQKKPFYDALKGICRECTDQQTFKQYTKQCVPKSLNTTCGADQFYNQITKTCDRKGTTSMCPPSTPYWDAQNFKCLKCPSDRPSYNDNTRKCQSCQTNQIWSNTYQLCIQKCSDDEQWNVQFKKCIKKDKNCTQKYAFSYQLNKCIQINCDVTKPYWNSSANSCQPCPPGTIYNYLTNNCQKDSRSGNVSVCHQDKPLWNSQYLRCEPCPSGKQWNSDLLECVAPKTNSGHHHMLEQLHESSIEQKRVYGHVYGNSKISYQHRELNIPTKQ